MPLTSVIAVSYYSQNVFELSLNRNGVLFSPGDCFAISNDDGVSRPYSTASGTNDSSLRFIIRRIPGGQVSEWLAKRKPGDPVEISAPFGWFRPGPKSDRERESVLIATGTGIAPFLSALRSYDGWRPAICLYGVRCLADAVEVAYLEQRCPLSLCISRETIHRYHPGRVTDLLDQMPITDKIDYYLCGLDGMVNQFSAELELRGVHYAQIHREVFFHA